MYCRPLTSVGYSFDSVAFQMNIIRSSVMRVVRAIGVVLDMQHRRGKSISIFAWAYFGLILWGTVSELGWVFYKRKCLVASICIVALILGCELDGLAPITSVEANTVGVDGYAHFVIANVSGISITRIVICVFARRILVLK